MTISKTSRATKRNTKDSQAAGSDQSVAEVTLELNPAENGDGDSKQVSILAPTHSKNSANKLEVQLYQPVPLPNNRPVVPSNLEVIHSDYLPNNRPISVSNLKVIESDSLPHNRPVFASAIAVVNSESLPNNRPVVASNLAIAKLGFLPGNRPIASNEIDDPEDLMGFLD